ncbi:MAG TPA: PepSY-like domain-containing protein [Puia sp.]|uniref:PepSY-like domain-containing protein n=1 Tax=Puia sp. TaxID=2045100 RepID=UPI002BECD026|nr:PepSY-like domain-containing protein [Puia sp.]HVU98029.1 PepSY-like domain-containing protein [Puia sp.]
MTIKFLPGLLAFFLFAMHSSAQTLSVAAVPAAVRAALANKYPAAAGVTWEKEKGNYEANWGGRSKEDNSVLFTPDGRFVQQVVAIPAGTLPPAVVKYVKEHYPGSRITEAGRVTDAAGETRYEVEVKGKDLVFDAAGRFFKID